jgi:hypothetical protein
MANYLKATDFGAKDALLSGDPNKIVKGTEINDEFDAIQTAVNSKANTNNAALTGTPTAPTASFGTSTTQIATTAFVQANISGAYPVGSLYINASNATNPATLLGFGTWEAFGTGKVLVGIDVGDAAFDTAGETGGSKDAIVVSHTHTATVTDPAHNHLSSTGDEFAGYGTNGVSSPGPVGLRYDGRGYTSTESTGITVANSTTGSSSTNANLQPYVVVYMWKRTA